jgi:thioredoxin-related protein
MFKKIIFLALSLIIGTTFAFAKVTWISEYDAALKAAKAADQLLLVQITSETCGYCRKMERDVFDTEEMKQICNKVKCAMFDNVLSPDGVQLSRKFKIAGTPATLLLDSDGGFIRMINGYVPLDRFKKEIETTISKIKEFDETLLILKKDPKNIEALSKAAAEFFDRRLYDKAVFFSNDIIKLDPDNKKGKTDAAFLLRAGVFLFQSNDIASGLQDLSFILNKWPASQSAKPALYLKGLILVHKGELDEGKRNLQQFKEKYPEDREMIRRIDSVLNRL